MHDPAVLAELQRRLADHGPLTFAEVMEVALYHPEGGYYTAHALLGPEGDFVTAPEEHPAFGALLARQAAQCWALLGHPDPFCVLEMGGGRGALAAAFLDHARARLPAMFAALRYVMLERSPRHRAMQRERLRSSLSEGGDRVTWTDILPPNVTGLILSNELVDAFPVHRVVMRGGELRERYVTAVPPQPLGQGDEGCWQDGALSTPDLRAYFDRLGITLAEGQIADVNLAAVTWMRQAARALERGFVLTMDFGHLATALFTPARKYGSLIAYYRQTASDDLLARLGRQDLFAQVDFSTLVAIGKEGGLAPLGLVTQHHALLDLGIEGWLAQAGPRDRRAMLELVRTGENGLGDAKLLVQARGAGGDLDALRPAARRANAAALRDIPPPRL